MSTPCLGKVVQYPLCAVFPVMRNHLVHAPLSSHVYRIAERSRRLRSNSRTGPKWKLDGRVTCYVYIVAVSTGKDAAMKFMCTCMLVL